MRKDLLRDENDPFDKAAPPPTYVSSRHVPLRHHGAHGARRGHPDADGYAGQITLGNDFSSKICMRTYGEWGLTAAFAFGCQRLSELGHDDWVHTLTVETPARLLAF